MKMLTVAAIIFLTFQSNKSFAFRYNYKNLNALSAFLCQTINQNNTNYTNEIIIGVKQIGPTPEEKVYNLSGHCQNKWQKESNTLVLTQKGDEIFSTFKYSDNLILGNIGLNQFKITLDKTKTPKIIEITSPLHSRVQKYSLRGSLWAKSDSLFVKNNERIKLIANGKLVATEIDSALKFAKGYIHKHFWTFKSIGCQKNSQNHNTCQILESKDKLSAM